MTRERVFNSSGKAFHAGHPLTSAVRIMTGGVPIGPGLHTPRLASVDFHRMKDAKDVNSTLCGFIGGKDMGKTAALKMIALRYRGWQSVGKLTDLERAALNDLEGITDIRQLTHEQRQAFEMRNAIRIGNGPRDVVHPNYYRITRTSMLINDRKHEDGRPDFEPTTHALHGTVISPLTSDKLNLFGLGLGLDFVDNLEIAHNTAEQINHSVVLTPGQALALRVAMHNMFEICKKGNENPNPRILRKLLFNQTYEEFDAYEREMDKSQFETKFLDKPELRKQLGYDRVNNGKIVTGQEYVPDLTEDEYRQECRRDSRFIYKLFDEFLEGIYSEVFGGEASLVDTFTQTVLDIDWLGLDPRVRDLLEGVIWKIRTVAMENNLLQLYPRLLISDEESDAAKSLLYLRFMFECVKKARAYSMVILWATQRLQDISEIGQPGSEERRLSEGIVDGMPCLMIFNHVDTPENRYTFNNLQISPNDQDTIFSLGVGQAGLWTPKLKYMEFMQFRPTELERPLIFSNSANASQLMHISNVNDAAAAERLRKRYAISDDDPGQIAMGQ